MYFVQYTVFLSQKIDNGFQLFPMTAVVGNIVFSATLHVADNPVARHDVARKHAHVIPN